MAKGLPKSFKKSLWAYHINSGSCNGCDIEIIAALCPRYDVERFGIKLVGSPRHADVLLTTGPVTRQMVDKIKRAYEQINFYKDLFSHDISNIIQVIHSTAELYTRY